MADSKITALTAISTVDPAADPLVIVDVSDTSMAASGTTKKATINQLLGASGTATLASATITGDLTVDTSTLKVDSANNRVGIGTASPAASLHVASGNVRLSDSAQVEFGGSTNSISGSNASNLIEIYTNNLRRHRIDSNGVATWSNVGGVGSTAMTLDATGLGVGGSPTSKLSIFAGADGDVGFFRGGSTRQLQIGTSATAGYLNADNGSAGFELRVNGTARAYFDTTGNVGIGVTPANWATIKALQVGSGASLFGYTATEATLSGNTYYNAGFKYVANGEASQYQQQIGEHRWYSASNNTLGAGQPITFLERMRLKSTGQLRFVPLASDPSGAEAGDVYYNSTSNKLKCYNGTTWNDLF